MNTFKDLQYALILERPKRPDAKMERMGSRLGNLEGS